MKTLLSLVCLNRRIQLPHLTRLQLYNYYHWLLSCLYIFTPHPDSRVKETAQQTYLILSRCPLPPRITLCLTHRVTHRPTYLIFGKDTGDCTGLDRADQTVSTSNRERHTKSYQATPLTPTINSTHTYRLDRRVFIFPRSSFCKVTWPFLLWQRFDPMSQWQAFLYLSVQFYRTPFVRSVYNVCACPSSRSIKHSDEPSLYQDTWFEIVQWAKRKVDCLGQRYRIQSYPRVYIVK